MDIFLGRPGGLHDGLVIAVLLDAESGHRFSGGGYAVHDPLGPAILDADDDDGRDVGVGTRADQRAKVQIQILSELQSAVGMRQRHGRGDIVGDGFTGRVREVIDREDDDMIANAHASILAAISLKRCIAEVLRHW